MLVNKLVKLFVVQSPPVMSPLVMVSSYTGD